MGSLFRDQSTFNQDICGWDISKITKWGLAFDGANALSNAN